MPVANAHHHNAQLIIFAGGGTGGHIFPNIAVAEHLHRIQPACQTHFLVSNRPLDARILEQAGLSHTPLPVQPLPSLIAPWRWPVFIAAWRASVAQVTRLIRLRKPAALVATGGFVSGPAVVAARRAALPIALVNLDAVAGKANRALGQKASKVFTVYPDAMSGQAIGLPLRQSALGPPDARQARKDLGLAPDRDTLLVTGGSQGAQTLNQLMPKLIALDPIRRQLRSWQVLHQAGDRDAPALADAYTHANIPASVVPFCDRMGLAWSAASLALSRAGAGAVAEAWANATPTIFLPYPYHKDQHQKHNVAPLLAIDGAVVYEDLIDSAANARQLTQPLLKLLDEPDLRHAMSHRLRTHWPGNGAEAIAVWLAQYLPML